jgi:hypothetical protein
MKTATPLLDQYISVAEGIIEEVWDALGGHCADCARSLSWCDDCEDLRVRAEEVQPVLSRLYAASTDDEARAIVATLPALAIAEAFGTGRAA